MKDLLIGIAIGGLVVGVAYAQQKPAELPAPANVGRYQIVNGTPEFAANIMLLDTATGDSWVKCSSDEIGNLWCRMPKSDGTTSPKK